MKIIFRSAVFIFLFLFTLFPNRLKADSGLFFPDEEPQISMDFQDANLKDILKVLSIQSGLNFIASESVQDRKITLYLDKVPLRQAMDQLFKANNLSYELDKDSNIFIVKDWGKPEVETITRIFHLKYASVSSSSLTKEVSDNLSSSSATGATLGAIGTGTSLGGAGKEGGITKVIEKLLSDKGSVIEDYRTNSLIVTDTPSRMPIIAKTIESLDVPVPMVMLEVEMLDVSKNLVDSLGFEFTDNPITLILPGEFARRGAELFIGTLARRKNKIDSSGAAGSVVLGSHFGQLLDFLHTQTDTKILARPRILTLNNETAEIRTVTDEVIGIISNYDDQGNLVSTEASRTDTGVSLRVTPQINLATKEITMFILPKVVDAATSALSASYRDPETRETKSLVKVHDGETVIVGGLIRNEKSVQVKKLPILGDIPVLGALFRNKSKDKDRERELLVFITPRIIKDANLEISQANKISLPEREQDILSGTNRKVSINSTLNDFENKGTAKTQRK